tara:strand:- start:424 stop:732 length:309 start_codon:yes stop_codon:yes gene_type:complete
MKHLQQKVRLFREERNWQKYHTPKNITLSMMSELGELAEQFQWRTDQECFEIGMSIPVCDEIADVAIYLLNLADILQIDLEREVERKIDKNAMKYPLDGETQ